MKYSGKYCIYKKGGSCPISLTSGYIRWDDEDNNNKNNQTGTLPDGVYDCNTKIEFCCRTDGDKNNPVSLPTLKPFFLLAYDSAECQQVKWAVVSVEWIRFDNEDSSNADDQGGSHPHGAGIDNHKIHYCYYQGKWIEVVNVSYVFICPILNPVLSNTYRLTHSASELSGFTCTSSLTMNEKFQYRTRPPSAVLKISSSLLVNECR